jgi:hypothetical protein
MAKFLKFSPSQKPCVSQKKPIIEQELLLDVELDKSLCP